MARKKTRKDFKNKQEIPSFSGKKLKPLPKTGLKVVFEFVDNEGVKYQNGTGRIKISTEGGVACLVKTEKGDWKAIKATLTSIKIIKYVKPKLVIQRKRNYRTAS